MEQHNFALIGAAGYIAPRHMQAIKENGQNLVAILDKSDSVGIIDRYFPQASYFSEPERFDRYIYKLNRNSESKVDFFSICSPNYLHDAHIRLALRNGSNAICEKPVVLNPWNLESLAEIERETGKRVFHILQLRLHPSVQALKAKVDAAPAGKIYDVDLTYITARGNWYLYSWKGDEAKSGGLTTNIGAHFFDMLLWIFGAAQDVIVTQRTRSAASGYLQLERARVHWFLSIDAQFLPPAVQQSGKTTYRALQIDGEAFEFSDGFTDLHTLSYQKILNGEGFGLSEAAPYVTLCHLVRTALTVHSA